MQRIDREDLALFCEESALRLERIGRALERLAACQPLDIELVHTLFRETHSLKGAANLLHLRPVEQLSHTLEEILDGIRGGSLAPDQPLLDLLSAGYARIGQLLQSPQVLPLIDVSREVAAIERHLAARRPALR